MKEGEKEMEEREEALSGAPRNLLTQEETDALLASTPKAPSPPELELDEADSELEKELPELDEKLEETTPMAPASVAPPPSAPEESVALAPLPMPKLRPRWRPWQWLVLIFLLMVFTTSVFYKIGLRKASQQVSPPQAAATATAKRPGGLVLVQPPASAGAKLSQLIYWSLGFLVFWIICMVILYFVRMRFSWKAFLAFIISEFFLILAFNQALKIYFWNGWLFWGGALVILLISLLFWLKNIPIVHVGLITLLGKRTNSCLGEGWNILPPFIFGIILVNVERKNIDFKPEDVRSGKSADGEFEAAELEISISLAWTPDKLNLVQYINIGGAGGVKGNLEDIIAQTCRTFAAERSWEDCLGASQAIAENLIFNMFGKEEDLAIISQGEDWGASDEDRQKARDARQKFISMAGKLKTMQEAVPFESLGIVINRLTIGRIRLIGELGKNLDLVAVERRQREAERIELKHVSERIKALQEELEISAEQARKIVQTERGKITEEIRKFEGLENLSGGLISLDAGGQRSSRGKKEEEDEK